MSLGLHLRVLHMRHGWTQVTLQEIGAERISDAELLDLLDEIRQEIGSSPGSPCRTCATSSC